MATSRRNRQGPATGHADRAPAAGYADRAPTIGHADRPPIESGGPIDVAALSAAIVAIALSMFTEKGPWQLLGMVLAVTLALVIYGYVWRNHRSVPQSLAIAAVLGVIAIPISGFAVELGMAHDRWSLIRDGEPKNCIDSQNNSHESTKNSDTAGKNKPECPSRVNNLWPIGTWVVIGGLVFLADLRKHKQRRRQ